ncbi:HTH domain-containing protein [Aquimarina sp. D1M17]|uniref:HTH domain-containing protein n=1 Tax=Aquimarina acroporae TaxID=2937283 RepID=UPI0020BF86C4|nr:HTH domain-containing protein [Aquimarina acroporae]MCK8523081.1 HTH domain-containing protein [Aquimarina acroporae]
MNVIIKQIELIERIDQLIHLRATGTPCELAQRLDVSKPTLYRLIRTMKALNAPIAYDVALGSFIYERSVRFQFGFYKNMGITEPLYSKSVC